MSTKKYLRSTPVAYPYPCPENEKCTQVEYPIFASNRHSTYVACHAKKQICNSTKDYNRLQGTTHPADNSVWPKRNINYRNVSIQNATSKEVKVVISNLIEMETPDDEGITSPLNTLPSLRSSSNSLNSQETVRASLKKPHPMDWIQLCERQESTSEERRVNVEERNISPNQSLELAINSYGSTPQFLSVSCGGVEVIEDRILSADSNMFVIRFNGENWWLGKYRIPSYAAGK